MTVAEDVYNAQIEFGEMVGWSFQVLPATNRRKR